MSIQTHEFFIRSSLAEVWNAMVLGERTEQYFFGSFVTSSWQPGTPIVYTAGRGGPVMVDGKVLEVDAQKRLVHTWTVRYDPTLADEESTVTYLLEPRGENVKLTLSHEFPRAPKTEKHLATDGWSIALSSMKSLLETGKGLVLPQP
jgi:uncharacterized protein YndB with AHSA1/START domain